MNADNVGMPPAHNGPIASSIEGSSNEAGPASQPETPAKREPSKLLSEAILLAMVTAAVYVAGYQFELGYARHFGIPEEYIVVSTQNLLSLAAAFVAIVGAFVQSFESVLSMFSSTEDQESSLLVLYFKKRWLMLLVPFAFLTASYYDPQVLLILAAAFGIPFLIDFFVPLMRRWTKRPYRDEFRDWLLTGYGIESTEKKFLGNKSLKSVYSYMLLLMLLGVLCLLAGRGAARARVLYPVIARDGKAEVIVRRYGDQLVLMRYDEQERKLIQDYRLVAIGDLKDKAVVKNLGSFGQMQFEKPGDESTSEAETWR